MHMLDSPTSITNSLLFNITILMPFLFCILGIYVLFLSIKFLKKGSKAFDIYIKKEEMKNGEGD